MEIDYSYKDYLNELEELKKSAKKPKILIQACCAPCSSEVINELKEYFEITIFYYNPNIYPLEEYDKRFEQFEKLPFNFDIINGEYETDKYYDAIKGYENDGEFSIRCYKCFEQRLIETARKASEEGYDYFTTTLSISPYKKSDWINEIGFRLAKEFNTKFLYSNFKKKEGYKKSIALSKEYNLYRQEYCGCVFSLNESKSK